MKSNVKESVLTEPISNKSVKRVVSEDMMNNFNDGKRIFVNRLRFYPKNVCSENMITFKQLMYKDMGFTKPMKGEIEVQTAIL